MSIKSILFFAYLSATNLQADSVQKTVSIGDLLLASGGKIENCIVGYRTAGTLNADKSNVLVFPTWFPGRTSELFDYELIGPGKLADADRYYVIAVDALGNGISSSPSNSETQQGGEFPSISIADIVRSQYLLLNRHLGIGHVRAVMGISLGGIQVYQWIGQYPNFMDKAISMVGTPAMTSYDLLQFKVHESAIGMLRDAGVSDSEIMKMLSSVNLLTLWTPRWFVENVAPEALPAFLAGEAETYVHKHPDDYISQLRAIMKHDVYQNPSDVQTAYLDRIEADFLIVTISSDHTVNPAPSRKLAGMDGVSYVEIESQCGHMGVICEVERIGNIVRDFLQ